MKTKLPNLRRGKFDFETLTVQFGGLKSKPENIFSATAIHIPPHTVMISEKEESEWYSGWKEIPHYIENEYAIMRDGVCIGLMYPVEGEFKTSLIPYFILPRHVLLHLNQPTV